MRKLALNKDVLTFSLNLFATMNWVSFSFFCVHFCTTLMKNIFLEVLSLLLTKYYFQVNKKLYVYHVENMIFTFCL